MKKKKDEIVIPDGLLNGINPFEFNAFESADAVEQDLQVQEQASVAAPQTDIKEEDQRERAPGRKRVSEPRTAKTAEPIDLSLMITNHADRNKITSFRCIPETVKNWVVKFAGEVDMPIGLAAWILLDFGIKEYQSGRIKISPKLSYGRYTIFPDVRTRVGRPARYENRQKRPDTVVFRGIPSDIKETLKAIADDKGIPLGEVARKFLTYGLAKHDEGLLPLPDPGNWSEEEWEKEMNDQIETEERGSQTKTYDWSAD